MYHIFVIYSLITGNAQLLSIERYCLVEESLLLVLPKLALVSDDSDLMLTELTHSSKIRQFTDWSVSSKHTRCSYLGSLSVVGINGLARRKCRTSGAHSHTLERVAGAIMIFAGISQLSVVYAV